MEPTADPSPNLDQNPHPEINAVRRRRMIDLPSDWSFDLPPTAEQQALDRQMAALDRFWGFCLTPREWWAAIGTAALVMTLGYVLCQLQMGLWEWPAPGHLWQSFIGFLKGGS